MKKYLAVLILSIYSLPALSISVEGKEGRDGIGRVTLKNGYPCLYLSNGERIINIQFSEQKNPAWFKPTEPNDGSSRDKCIIFNGDGQVGFKYNNPIGIYLNDKSRPNLKEAHDIFFCVVKTDNSLRLVRSDGQGGCSNQAWKPVKKYDSSLFGRIEEMWDKIFRLNGYTEETF